jgi:dTDP-4-amino-4,6-dideoxygalactose transaminase
VQLVKQEPGRVSSNHLIVAEVDEREDFRRELETRGVQTGLHYPVPCHLQKAYFEGGNTPSKPVAESAARRIVSLPVWGQMPEDDVVFVCEQIGALRR